MDWIDAVLFEAPRALDIEPIIYSRHIHTGDGELRV